MAAIVEAKSRNPSWGCPRIAQQPSLTFDVEINKDVVRRVLAKHYRPDTPERAVRPGSLSLARPKIASAASICSAVNRPHSRLIGCSLLCITLLVGTSASGSSKVTLMVGPCVACLIVPSQQ